MAMLAITIGMLFAAGFAGGYYTRAAFSWVRRSKLRKLRAERDADVVLKQTGNTVAQNAATVAMGRSNG